MFFIGIIIGFTGGVLFSWWLANLPDELSND
jgi:hypothetical protein